MSDLFADPVFERGSCNCALLGAKGIFPSTPEAAIQVGFKPGVTDNAGQAGLDGLLTLYPELRNAAQVAQWRTYLFWGLPEGIALSHLANAPPNPMKEPGAHTDEAARSGVVYPHIYGKINADAVIGVLGLTTGGDGQFTELVSG